MMKDTRSAVIISFSWHSLQQLALAWLLVALVTDGKEYFRKLKIE